MNALAIPFPLVSPQELAAVIADRIEAHARAMDALIVLLDALDGDPDLEPSLGAPEAKVDLPWGTVFMVRTQDGDQSMWAPAVQPAELGPMKPVAYSVSQVLALVGISRTTFYALVKAGKIPVRKVGTRSFVLAKDLESWLESLPVLHDFGGAE